jgi:uncharacterized protein (UPF0332 family)
VSPAGPSGLEKCRRLLRSASLLLADGDYESAVSRAYYAMFHAAEALLASKGHSFSSHSAVVSAFGREFAKTGDLPTHLHRLFIEASPARQAADYMDASALSAERKLRLTLTMRSSSFGRRSNTSGIGPPKLTFLGDNGFMVVQVAVAGQRLAGARL